MGAVDDSNRSGTFVLAGETMEGRECMSFTGMVAPCGSWACQGKFWAATLDYVI